MRDSVMHVYLQIMSNVKFASKAYVCFFFFLFLYDTN